MEENILTKRFNDLVKKNEVHYNSKLMKTFEQFSKKYPNAKINGKSYNDLKAEQK